MEQTAFRIQERALDLFRDIGMRIRYMNPVAHDRHIAYVSHLSHISSFMLGKTVIEETLDEYISNLQGFRALMQEGNFDGVFDEMQQTNRIKEILRGIPTPKT